MKKILISAICLAALLLLAGCGGNEGVDTTDSATDQTAQTTAETAASETTAPVETTAPETTEPSVKETIYKDGIYEGIGYGNNNNPVQVRIEIKDDQIVQMEIVSNNDTPEYFGSAWDSIYAAVMGQESPDLSEVDAVSGATNSSRGIIDAIKAALYKARK